MTDSMIFTSYVCSFHPYQVQEQGLIQLLDPKGQWPDLNRAYNECLDELSEMLRIQGEGKKKEQDVSAIHWTLRYVVREKVPRYAVGELHANVGVTYVSSDLVSIRYGTAIPEALVAHSEREGDGALNRFLRDWAELQVPVDVREFHRQWGELHGRLGKEAWQELGSLLLAGMGASNTKANGYQEREILSLLSEEGQQRLTKLMEAARQYSAGFADGCTESARMNHLFFTQFSRFR